MTWRDKKCNNSINDKLILIYNKVNYIYFYCHCHDEKEKRLSESLVMSRNEIKKNRKRRKLPPWKFSEKIQNSNRVLTCCYAFAQVWGKCPQPSISVSTSLLLALMQKFCQLFKYCRISFSNVTILKIFPRELIL